MVRVVGGMNELTDLCFRWCSEIECLIDTTYLHVGSFQVDTLLPKLVRLELSYMDNLKEVCRGPPFLVLGFFEKLEQLFVRNCQHLHSIFPEACNLCNLKILKIGNCAVVSLFSVSVAQSLQKLQELSIEDCKELKHIITSEGEGGTNTGDNSHLMFPNLKKILVSYCPKLEFIFPISFAIQDPSQLQEIQVSHASELKYVFGQYEHEAHSSHQNQIQIMLAQLKVFELHDVKNLLAICPENYHLRYPSLVKLSYDSVPKLTTSCTNRIVSSTERQQYLNMGVALDEDQQNHLTSNLQQLELHELPELKFIWSGSTPRKVLSFQFLQLLKLDNCANLKSVFSIAIQRSLSELTSLSIYRCDELEEIMAENEQPQNLSSTEVCFPKLSELVIKKCDKLKSLFSIAMVGMSLQLRTLRISEAAQLEVVFRHSSEYNIDNKDQIMLPSLENLKLKKFPSFVNVFQGFNFQAPKLQEISTHECPKFAPILRGTQVISLPHTEERHVFCLITTTWSELCGRRFCAALEAFLKLEVLRETKSKVQGIFHLQVEAETNSNIEWKPLYLNLRELELCDLLELRFIWKGLPKYLSLEKLEKVSLVNCPKLKIVFSPDIVKCLPNLEYFSISNCEELEEIISSDSENAQLKPSSSRPKQEVCFPNLFFIQVKQCNKLKCLFYDSMTCHFPTLSYLAIEECSQLEQAFGFKIEAGDKSFQREASEDGHLILFPKLHFLTVMDCPKYRLTSRESSTSCQHVTTQGQIFWLITTSSSLQSFLTLKVLDLTKSRAECIFQLQVEGEISSNNEWMPLNSSLRYLTLHDLPELRFIWKDFSKFLSLEELTYVSLVDCPQLKSIFSPCIVRCLPELRRLSISNCEKLEEIMSSDLENAQLRHATACPPQEVCFPQLIMIEVNQCNKLKCLFYDSMAYHFPKLESLEIEECSQIEQVFGSKGRADDESSQRWANEDGDRILLPKLRKLVLRSLPIFVEISRGFNLSQPMHKYLVTDCPRYNSTFDEASTSYQHTTTQGEHSDEESQESSDGEFW